MTRSGDTVTEGILFTDQYQLTMAQLYFLEGLHERASRFDYFFRSYPDYGAHRAGFCVLAGLDPLLDWMEQTTATVGDIEYLRALIGSKGSRRFGDDFLEWMEGAGSFVGGRVQAVAEGRVVHPHEPVVTVEGPLAMMQILETALLNHLNYPTLIATKAARVALAARGRPVLEFGMRRGPAWGANPATRAALIGGADFTSNVGMSRRLGVDPKGTHAHSLVQVFIAAGGDELEAFRAYARRYPDDCLLLIDTVDTLESGLPNAIVVFRELRAAGHDPVGIRLDSGDLARLAVAAASRLDAAGFGDTQIVLSSDLDEQEIAEILARIEAESADRGVDAGSVTARLAYGVGTRLVTSHGDPALGGVYKLAAIEIDGDWRPALKRSDSPGKVPIAGRKQLWRVYDDAGTARADVIGLSGEDPPPGRELSVQPIFGDGGSRFLSASEVGEIEPLHEVVFTGGVRLAPAADLDTLRRRRSADVERLSPETRELVSPAVYDVVLTDRLKRLQTSLMTGLTGERPL